MKKKNRVPVLLDDGQRQTLERASDYYGVGVSVFLRMVGLERAREIEKECMVTLPNGKDTT